MKRNDLYVTLTEGEFSQDRKKSAKNIEVSMQVRNEKAEILKDCIYWGDKFVSQYRSRVIYHQNNPIFKETVHLRIPQNYTNCHLFFVIKHCSTSESKTIIGTWLQTITNVVNPKYLLLRQK